MRVRSSTKIAIGFALLVGGGYFGWNLFQALTINRETFKPLKPDSVNLIGVSADGFRIILANDIAQLIEGKKEEFESPGAGEEGGGGKKKRVPMKELLGSLKGDEVALGKFLMIMNDIKEESLPPIRVEWDAADIQKALKGDPVLEKKLIQDLNINLDGTPTDFLKIRSMQNGIVIKAPVPVHVSIEGEDKLLNGIVLLAYRPRLMQAVEARYQDKAIVTDQMIVGYYREEVANVQNSPRNKENVRASLESILDPKGLARYAETPEKILSGAHVIVNKSLIKDAQEVPQKINGKEYSDLVIHLKDEGRKRLWKYTQNKVGSQILLIVDNVAIAAPRIEHVLAQEEFTVKQLPDPVLVREALKTINASGEK